MINDGRQQGIVGINGQKGGCRVYRRTTTPQAGFTWVAGGGQAVLAPVSCNQQRVSIVPCDIRFGFGYDEAGFNKRPAGERKLADDGFVLAAARQPYEAVALLIASAIDGLVDPVFTFVATQFVNVEYGFPLRFTVREAAN